MSSADLHADPATVGDSHDDTELVAISRSRLQELEACTARAELDARNVQLLQERVSQLTHALERKDELGERQAEALMEVARASDNRARDLEAQYAAKLAKVEFTHDAVVAAKDASIADMARRFAELEASHARTVAAMDTSATDLRTALTDSRTALATRERELASLRAETAAQLLAVHTAVTSKLALELHPVRRDHRRFATLHAGPVSLDEFDTAWSVGACGKTCVVDIDPVTHMRAHVTQGSGRGSVTLRGAVPLPRRLPVAGASPQQLPSYRVVIESYPAAVDGEDTQCCNVGFVPSHTSTDGAAVTPTVGNSIYHHGGWWLQAHLSARRSLRLGPTIFGWTPLLPRPAAARAGDAAAADTSAYATTDGVPPVPVGSAVEFAVDYAAGTCRVAFYTPAAVVGGFVEAPYAKMELRFVATAAEAVPEWGAVPARSVPTAAADSRVQLYPAVAAARVGTGTVWRFV